MNAKGLMSLAVVVVSMVAGAETYTWTGAQNGFWTNAANWAVGGEVATKCPGVCSNEIFAADGSVTDDWTTRVALADLAEFTTVADGKATTIDLEGHYCVSSIVFRAGCPRFTLGTSADQVIAIQAVRANSKASGGYFTVEKDAGMPQLKAGFSVGLSYKGLQASGDTATGVSVIQNMSVEELVFGSFGHSRTPGNSCTTHVQTSFEGAGGYRFAGPYRGMGKSGTTRQNSQLRFKGSGKITFAAPVFGRGRAADGTRDPEDWHGLLKLYFEGSCTDVEILEGCRVALSDWNEPTLEFNGFVRVHGKGVLQTGIQSNKPLNVNYGTINVKDNKTATIETTFDVADCQGVNKHNLRFYGDGTYRGTFFFDGPTNRVNGFIMFRNPAVYKARRTIDFGLGDLALFEGNGVFEYAGDTDETFSRECIVYKGKTATVRNTGSGTVTVTSVVTPSNGVSGTSFCLKPETAPMVFAGSFAGTGDSASTLVISGAGISRIASMENLANAKAVCLSGGTLDLSTLATEDGMIAFTTPVTFDGGASAVLVPDGQTLEIPSLASQEGQSTNKLNFVCGTGRVKVTGQTSASPVPAGVMMNGCPVSFADDGQLVTVPPAYDVQIAAHGDVVPDDATKVVAITTDGTGGNDTLAANVTSVKTLVHCTDADATVEIGEGRSLSAGRLEVYGKSGNLDIGTEDDLGTVSGLDGILWLGNSNFLRMLTVNAQVAPGTDVRVDGNEGVLTLAGGLAEGAKASVMRGSLCLTGSRTFNLSGTIVGTNSTELLEARLTLDGARDVCVGKDPFHVGWAFGRVDGAKAIGRFVVTNSLVRPLTALKDITYANDTTNDAICVGIRNEAVMEIRAGAVVTNRLIVGGTYLSNKVQSHGAVYQDGGEMVALGGASDSWCGSHIGTTDGMGSYELRGGRFVMMGNLAIGYYGRGSFNQYGGYSLFTNSPTKTAKSTIGPSASANGGESVMRFVGGRADIRSNVVLSGGLTNQGQSFLSVENDAAVDAADNTVKLCGSHSADGPTHNYTKAADVILSADGWLRAAGFFCGYDAQCPQYKQFYSVGFDGGTFATGANDKDIARATVSDSTQTMTNFVVYAGGMTVDTEGKTGNRSSAPIRGAWGNGVASVPFSGAYGGFVAAPYVIIKGDGVGATATVDFDTMSGKVTGIRLLTPGVGYTTATAYFYRDNGYQYADGLWSGADCPLAPNVNTGSFTKKGEGDFTLGAANTWGGATILKGGVLRLGVTGALPEGSKVVYDGGTLAVADGVELPATLNIEVPNLTDGMKVSLLTFEGTVPATLPAIRCEGLDANEWKFALYGQTLKLAPVRGMTLLVR